MAPTCSAGAFTLLKKIRFFLQTPALMPNCRKKCIFLLKTHFFLTKSRKNGHFFYFWPFFIYFVEKALWI